MMDFRKLQKDVYQNKVDKGFNTTDVNKEFCLTYAELAEAYDAWLKKKDDVGEELADVVIFTMGLSEILGVDLESEGKIRIMETFDMSKEELDGFFNKYNISELEAFKVIMQYVYDYEKEEIEKILNSVKNNKEQNYKEVCFKEEFNLSNITDKNDLLNDKELVFLYKIVNDALLCLSSIKHMDVEYETIETSKIENSLYDKISRKSNGIKMLKLIEE